jgi:hypothetical protein
MTTPFRLEHDFPEISLKKFEKYLNHPKLNEMLAGMPAFRGRDLIEEQKLPNGETHWKFKVVAGGEIPPAIAKVVSPDMFAWIETSRFVPNEHCIHFTIEPIVAKDKFSGAGKWLLLSDKKGTKRVIEGEFTFKIPFIGKLVESYLIKELKRNYEVEPEIQRRFYAEVP